MVIISYIIYILFRETDDKLTDLGVHLCARGGTPKFGRCKSEEFLFTN